MGATYKIVSTPENTAGKIKINGVKHTISRANETMIALVGLPDAWKKIECILIKQLTEINERKIRNAFSPNSQ